MSELKNPPTTAPVVPAEVPVEPLGAHDQRPEGVRDRIAAAKALIESKDHAKARQKLAMARNLARVLGKRDQKAAEAFLAEIKTLDASCIAAVRTERAGK